MCFEVWVFVGKTSLYSPAFLEAWGGRRIYGQALGNDQKNSEICPELHSAFSTRSVVLM